MCDQTQQLTQWLDQFMPFMLETTQIFATVSYLSGLVTGAVVVFLFNFKRNKQHV